MTPTINPASCNHQWQRMHEEMIFGGIAPAGFRCKICRQYVSLSDLTPAGLGGANTGEEVLQGPNGGNGNLSDGTVYREQIIYPDGSREVLRPNGDIEKVR